MLTGTEIIELTLLNVVSTALVDVGNGRPDVEAITELIDAMTVSVDAELPTTEAVGVDFAVS